MNGFAGVNVWLFSCDPSKSLAHSKTDSIGAFRFANLAAGSYYLIAQPPTGFIFSSGNNNDDDDDSMESTINAEDGRTTCFELRYGEKATDWNFGLYKPGEQGTTLEPSNAPAIDVDICVSTLQSGGLSPSTDAPSMRPTRRPSESPARIIHQWFRHGSARK